MPAPPRTSRRAMAQVYADLGPKIRAKVRRMATKLGLDADALEQDADLTFVEAYLNHDPDRGPFDVRVMFLACARVTDAHRVRQTRARYESRTSADLVSGRRTPEPYSLGRLSRYLSADARLLLALIFDDPEESGHDVWGREVSECPDVTLRGYCRDRLGWSRGRIDAAFSAVRAMK